ncbi:hypothetical protein CCR94_21950 [Rhodoblastus sphagnicola]|uniref:PepSY domain-containing protein n=1 Tax=Rhodoblastus sphagnicola TaxID=333368 RepID=A0A2S6MW87_9HYPH|nr:PepSY domain-containing protein [Rhodoblastus sphagnicola]MBB4196670.1 putative membrane protein YkoI [Rhodoblastus sphagnicola]PPQ26630.1 hypothetical protein CCR94_21950 [Rhodoblastus sphagnicola]
MTGSHWNLVAAVAVALCVATPGRAESVSPETARDLVRNGDILALHDVLSRIRPAIEGEIIAVALETDGRRFLYRIKALGRDGRYRDYRADAKDGAAVHDP